MPTLPDPFETLGARGEHAGADAVVRRALARAGTGPAPVHLTPSHSRGSRRARNYGRALVAAALTIALIAVPVALSRSGREHGPSREPSGPAYPPPSSATAAQLETLQWSRIPEAPIALNPTNQVVAWAGNELIVFGQGHDSHGDGAAYTPATNRWRTLPRAPLRGAWFFRSSWSFARYDADTTAFTGAALVAMLRGSTQGGLFAWDLASGRRTELAEPPANLIASAWTGHELIAIAFGEAGGPAIAYRLG